MIVTVRAWRPNAKTNRLRSQLRGTAFHVHVHVHLYITYVYIEDAAFARAGSPSVSRRAVGARIHPQSVPCKFDVYKTGSTAHFLFCPAQYDTPQYEK